jgi:hypothetical protein
MEAIYRRRLLKLAKFLREKVPAKLFNLEIYLDADKKGHKHAHAAVSCGTSGCALGWATAKFPRDLRYNKTIDLVTCIKVASDAGGFFGINWHNNRDLWMWLFGPHHRRTPCQEAKVIEQFVKTGVIPK